MTKKGLSNGDTRRSFDRRTVLKLSSVGVGVGGLTTALSSGDGVDPTPLDIDGYAPERVVDLGEEGLSAGDVIDPYLKEYFVDGTEVRIPAGAYVWRGGGFHRNANRHAGLVGEGHVVLRAVNRFYHNTVVSDGVLVFKNMTVKGQVVGRLDRSCRIRLETERGGRILVDNWNFPDGAQVGRGEQTRAFFVPESHAGVIEIRNCSIAGMGDNGIYASPPGTGRGGRVIIDGCLSLNNNVAGFRIGGHESVVRNSIVVNDAIAPSRADRGPNQRGIRIDSPARKMRIENVDIVHTDAVHGGPIRWSSTGSESTGTIADVRIHNDTSHAAIADQRDYASGWRGHSIDVTGDGNLDVPDWFDDVCQGDDCAAPAIDTHDERLASLRNRRVDKRGV